MVGQGTNRGIVPLCAEEIFKMIAVQSSPTRQFEVTASMLEIYNERVQDLLVPVGCRPVGGLKVRESRAIGVFVEGLSKEAVSSYEEIE